PARSRPVARDERLSLHRECFLMEAVELRPRTERACVGDAVDEEGSVEGVELVLERTRCQPLHVELEVVTVAIPGADAHPCVALHLPAKIRNAQAALEVHEGFGRRRADDR